MTAPDETPDTTATLHEQFSELGIDLDDLEGDEEVLGQIKSADFDYRAMNTSLFNRRMDLQKRIARIDKIAVDERTPEQRRTHARIARQLDVLTGEIVQANYGLVRTQVRKYSGSASMDDIAEFEQAAVLGLMIAIDKFDPAKGKFGAWAYIFIQRELIQAVWRTDHSNLLLGDFEKRKRVLIVVREMELLDPDVVIDRPEVSRRSGATLEQVNRIIDAPHLLSLNAPIGDDGTSTVADTVADDVSVEDSVISQLSLASLEQYGLPRLTSQELFVMLRREGLDGEEKQTLNDIGEMLGQSREAVRQAYKRGMAKLKHPVVLHDIVHGEAS